MEIFWYGHACFRLKGRRSTVVTDPYDSALGLSLPAINGNIVTVSHDSPHHNYIEGVEGDFKVVDGPGEYEIGGVFIAGIHVAAKKNSDETENSVTPNNVFVIDLDNVTLCHLGDLNHVPTQKQVEDMGNIDVLMIPVGGHSALNASQAAEVISLIEPQIVIPMHYALPNLAIELDPLNKFLKEMGITKTETIDSLKVTKSTLPEETQIHLLTAKV